MYKKIIQNSGVFLFASVLLITCTEIQNNAEQLQRWSVEKANEWYDKYPFWVGANYVPASAINCVCVWREHTWLVMPDEMGKFADRVLGHGTPFKKKWKMVVYRVL